MDLHGLRNPDFWKEYYQNVQGQIGKINANTLPLILDWLAQHEIPYDEIHVGKPWCGTEGFYVDDKAVRPSEFLASASFSTRTPSTSRARAVSLASALVLRWSISIASSGILYRIHRLLRQR